MNNLTTRKIVLGLLMALVLAFSVQGTADAITKFTRGAGDLQLHAPGDDFTVSFRAGVQSPSIKAGFKRVPTKNTEGAVVTIGADTPYYEDTGVTGYQNETQVSYADAYNYDQEAINIVVGGATLTKVGTYGVGGAPHRMNEGGVNATRLTSSSVTLTLTAAAGTVIVTITDQTNQNDLPSNVTPLTTALVFTVYIAPTHNDTSTITAPEALDFSLGEKQIDDDFGGNLTNVRVNYTVSGSGSVYVKIGDRKGRGSSNLTTSSAAPVFLDMGRSTNKVTASVVGQRADRAVSVTYIYGSATLTKDSGDKQRGAASSKLANPLVVRVTDGNTRGVSGVQINFTATDSSGSFRRDSSFPSNLYVPETGNPTGVKTNSSGLANIFWVLDDTGDQTATATLGSDAITVIQANRPVFTATFGTTTSTASSIVIESGDGQRADEFGLLEDPLVVVVRDQRGQRLNEAEVRFIARDGGTLVEPSGDDPGESTQDGTSSAIIQDVDTNPSGEASVRYTPPDGGGRRTVSASLQDNPTKSVIFTVNGAPSSGGGGGGGDDDDEDDTPPPVSATVPSSVTGTAGGTTVLTFTTNAASVFVGSPTVDTFPIANISTPTQSGTTHTRTLTLPSPGTYTLGVYINNTRHQVTVTVTAAAQTGGNLTVRVDPFTGAPGTTATVTVTASTIAADSSAQPASVTVNLTATGGKLSRPSVVTGFDGTTTVTLTRGSTAGSENHVTVSATNYTTVRSRFVIAGPAGRDTTVGEAAELNVYDGNNQDGSLNSRLAEPFIVEVVDANDNPVEDARVRFRTTVGNGRFSPRTPRTDEDGLAETTFTPTTAGRIRVVATVAGVDGTAAFIVQAGEPADALVKVSGDDQTGTPGNALANPFVVEVQDEDGEPLTGHSVTFSVTAGGGSLSATSARTNANGRAQTTLTLGSALGVNSVRASVTGVDSVTFSTSIDAQILVAAANRPVMYWIAGGGLYSLSGAKEAKIAESANGVAVGGGKIYWTSQINPSSGTINSANLDGTDAAVLTSILAVPMGISVDTAGSKLYWTNTRGRIQSANLNGSGIQNVLLDLSAPTDIVVSNGFIYWTEGGNSVRRVNISGQKVVIDVAVNLDSVGGLAVSGGKVYWTEQTGASAGTVNGANLNGTNFEALATLLSAPMGISVDTAGSKLYWTNARGRVQSANLDGSMITNVVEGLISPSKIAIGGANTETVATTAKKATTPAKKDNAKYDVNGDGKVDNVDASLVASGLGTGNAKYDVDGDGTVNFLDLLLVFDNRDDDAAAAPAIVGMKLNAVQIDRIEEQIDLLLATNDRSPAAMRTLVYLQQLLVTARPEKTQLFANYPNPFNPETWIPYELATDTHVKITIYNTQGVVIRSLQLGHQSAGYYTDRDRAVYWDGRNAFGEQVASGLYFYQLETDEMSSMRKMVILK